MAIEYLPHDNDGLRIERGDTFHIDSRSLKIKNPVGGVINGTRASMYLDLEGQEDAGVRHIPELRDIEQVPGRPGHWRYRGAKDTGNDDKSEGWGKDTIGRWFS